MGGTILRLAKDQSRPFGENEEESVGNRNQQGRCFEAQSITYLYTLPAKHDADNLGKRGNKNEESVKLLSFSAALLSARRGLTYSASKHVTWDFC